MTTTPRHPLVEEYLGELERQSARMAPDARRELLAELRDHVDAGAGEAHSEADIRNMLDALGDPEDIVRAAEPVAPAPPEGAVPTGRLALGFGIAALVLVPTGFLAVAFGIAAVILGVRARNRLQSAGLPTPTATAGAVTGGVAVAVVVLLFSFLVSARTSSSDSPEPATVVPAPEQAPTTAGVG